MSGWKGGCACGAVRWESEAPPTFSFHCQCRQCQRATGTGHASAFVLAEAGVRLDGELRFFEQQSDAGNTVGRGFCPTCGSPVLNRNSGYPGSLYVHAATLDDPSRFEPTTVVFGEAAQPWDAMDPSLR